MLQRMSGLGIVVFWVVSTSWLVWHDVVPAWTAQQPPRAVARGWIEQYGRESQFGIYDQWDRRIGGVWTRYTSGTSTDRQDEIYVHELPILGAAFIEIRSSFNLAGQLDEIDIAVLGDWTPVRIHGERYHKEFAFRIDSGLFKQAFKIDLAVAGTFSDMFRPFDAMPNLQVGQAWRMQVFNPAAVVLGVGERFTQKLVQVTAREVIELNGGPRDCLVVEAPNVKAWVERSSGLVLVQQITLPIGGTYTVKMEPHDADALRRASDAFQQSRKGPLIGTPDRS